MKVRLAALLILAVAGTASPQPQVFSERMTVREVGIVADLPQSGAGPRDLVVMEGGLARSVTRTGEVDGPWNAVVYVDRELARAETVFLATLALAGRSDRLAGLGNVEIVVAEPSPRVVLAGTREARRLREALAEVAGKARVERDEGAGRLAPPDAAVLRRQVDRLVTALAGYPGPGPRVLFLVVDGFDVTPQELAALSDPGKAAEGRAEILREAARMLAAYGWVTVALPLRPEEAGQEDREVEAGDRFRDNHGHWGNPRGSLGNSVPPNVQIRGRPSDSRLRWDGQIDLQIQPSYAPLRALAAATTGMVLGYGELVDSALDDLAALDQVFYRTDTLPDGQVRPLEIRLVDGRPARARAWVRSSTPEEISEARLRRMLAGSSLPASLPLKVEVQPSGPARWRVKLRVDPFVGPEPLVPGPVRLSFAPAGEEDPIEIRHQTAPGIERPDQGWSHTADIIVPEGARRIAVAIEDLARERWSGIVLDLAPVRPR